MYSSLLTSLDDVVKRHWRLLAVGHCDVEFGVESTFVQQCAQG